jgi:hypothetical protein
MPFAALVVVLATCLAQHPWQTLEIWLSWKNCVYEGGEEHRIGRIKRIGYLSTEISGGAEILTSLQGQLPLLRYRKNRGLAGSAAGTPGLRVISSSPWHPITTVALLLRHRWCNSGASFATPESVFRTRRYPIRFQKRF